MARSFEDLVAEAAAANVDGWDFSWLDGRASEQRPAWAYAKTLGQKMAAARAALDLQTGGGEVLADIPRRAPLTIATEAWPPNVERATRLLHPLGVAVVAHDPDDPLPFGAEAFDLVVSRHPVSVRWDEAARVLRPGGRYFSQEVGPRSVGELTEFMMGPQPADGQEREPELARSAAQAAGLTVTDLRSAELRTEFGDIGAVIYFLRKVIWIVPGFTVDGYLTRLRALHDQITEHGPFQATTRRFLIEAIK